MDLIKLNDISQIVLKPKVKVNELELNAKYRIIKLRSGVAKQGGYRYISCELEEAVVFLPKRLVESLAEDDIQDINRRNLCLTYLGMVDVGKQQQTPSIKFIAANEDTQS